MPSITVPVLNNLSAFQTIIQGENVGEAKRLLIETVTQMNARRWKWRCFASSCTAIKSEAENGLLAALNASSSMDEIKQALGHYMQQLNDLQHGTHPQGNTSAFIKGIGPLVDRLYSLEKLSKAGDESTKLLSCISDRPGYLVNMPESIHIDIMKAMEKTGYYPNEKGMCYGIAWTALLACVRQGGQAYMKRMQYLKQMDIPPLPGTDDTHQVYPFFDTVTLSMTNYNKMDNYEKGIGYPGRQEVAFPGRIIGGHEPDYQVPSVKHAFIAECTCQTFVRFLQKTRKNNKRIPFGVMINYSSHATSIGFDGNKWLAVDHDKHYYTKNTVLLYTFLREQSDFHKDGKIIASMEVVAGNGHSLNINKDTLVFNVKKSVSLPLALRLALQYDDVNVTTDCITVISQQGHTPEIFLEILSCKGVGNVPGFFVALQQGCSGTITAFIQESAVLIAKLYLPNAEKVKWLCELLASKSTDDTPGFYAALRQGHSDAITAFIQASTAAIVTLPLPEKRKAELLFELLACKEADGTPGFHVALQQGHSDAITAFIQASTAAIATLPLSEKRKAELLFELLASKEVNGIPGFFMALQDGHTGAIATFIQASAVAIASLSLSNVEKAKWLCELLACKKANGIPGFFMTLQNGHAEAITAFIQKNAAVMATLCESEEERTKLLYSLLASKAADGTHGFYMTLQEKHPEAITAFIQASTAAIATLPLSEERKAKLLYRLLASKRVDDLPGFYMVLLSGHAETVIAFIQASAAAIATLSLSEIEKAKWLCELLACKKANGTPGFFMTLQYGYAEAITTFIQISAAAIAALSLPGEQKVKLLQSLLVGKRADGLPGFYITLREGYTDAITAFIETSAAVMAIFCESEEEISDLLFGLFDSMLCDNKAKFLLAMKQGGPAVIKAFTKCIDQLPLSISQKEALKYPTSDSVENTVAVNQ